VTNIIQEQKQEKPKVLNGGYLCSWQNIHY